MQMDHLTPPLPRINVTLKYSIKIKRNQILKLHRPSFPQRNIMCTVRNINLNVPILVPNLFICDSLRTPIYFMVNGWLIYFFFLIVCI